MSKESIKADLRNWIRFSVDYRHSYSVILFISDYKIEKSNA